MESAQMLSTLQRANDIDALLEEIKTTKFIGEVTHKEIEGHISNGTIRFLYEDDKLLGFGAWQIVNPQWREIGPLYVIEAAREKGVARQVIDEMFAINAAYNLYVVTKNPVIGYLAKQYQFSQTSMVKLPKPLKIHLIRKFNLVRIIHLLTKFSRDPVLHYIRKVENEK
ncbi:MAG: hypothetical protein BroJett018_07240 [Chloroflexota bacterium]|nr:N-acetyltransferase [Chloroflexota bacterium]NOG63118.1 GNAT family N-acetyltransferase [Chloroflexota bacterium]GIK62930.1 MAG: hypothetical protein BroJett018_07240 [Chloroflexota bacterium]